MTERETLIREEAKEEYKKLLASGLMFEFYPEFTGEYKKDWQYWLMMYKKLKRLRKD